MTYEVYITARHHPRHLDSEQVTTSRGKYVEPEGSDPAPAQRMRTVCHTTSSEAPTTSWSR